MCADCIFEKKCNFGIISPYNAEYFNFNIMMKRFLILLIISFFYLNSMQAQTKFIDLEISSNQNQNDYLNTVPASAEKYQPTIRVFLPEKIKATGRAVLILPGGGYSHLAMDHEGYKFAPFFNDLGIAAIVLKYRMPYGNFRVPGDDVREAIKLIRKNAAEWNIDVQQIGIMGSSAGGHLASTIATQIESDLKPAFQILLYPVISMDTTITHRGSHDNLLGKHPDKSLVLKFSNDLRVDKNTPKAFIALSGDDKTVLPVNSINYYKALNDNKISASLHIYPTGGHGWGYNDNFKFKETFLSELRLWLKTI